MASSKSSSLPVVNVEFVSIYNEKTNVCGEFLKKKTANSIFQRWQERFFYIDVQISDSQNYALYYSHSDKKLDGSKKIRLEFATVEEVDPKLFTFRLIASDKSSHELRAANIKSYASWIQSLNYVIDKATERSKIFVGISSKINNSASFTARTAYDDQVIRHSSLFVVR